jgi:hypothetical protein
VVFRIPVNGCPDNRSVQANQWKVLALCNGMRSVSDIAETLGWQLFETSQTLCGMVRDGLLEKAAEKRGGEPEKMRRTVNGNFFPFIENELRKVMGPIAPIVIDDKLAEFGQSREAFPEDRLPPFVQAIGEEITDTSKRALFTRQMTEYLAGRQK